jgi:nucleotide-binding universal stress UspA family protein
METKYPPDSPSGVSTSSEQASDGRSNDRLVTYQNLLVPIDFSEHSKQTIGYATQLAAFTGARIMILHVFQIPDYPAAFYQGLYIEHEQVRIHVDTAKREANGQLALIAEQIRAKGLEAQAGLRLGNPYEEIVDEAKEMGADLIVIGSHGSRGLGRLLLGSTAERVVQYSPCAVLIVKDAPGHH